MALRAPPRAELRRLASRPQLQRRDHYDCATRQFKEEDNDYDFSRLGPKYIDGPAGTARAFPSFQVMTFVDNSTPRPQTFCDVDRGPDHFGTAAYNAEWSKLLAAIDALLVAHGWQARATTTSRTSRRARADYDVAASPRRAHQGRRAQPADRDQRGAEARRSSMTRAPAARATTCGGPICPHFIGRLREDPSGQGRGRMVVLPLRRPAAVLQSDHDRPPGYRVWIAFLAAGSIESAASPTTR